ncbi:MAG TPA: hypothetical protein VFN45_12955 [Myxococcaceae bacterium]|nr:hypothetical protein [Myxococcaceae bacterium]
MRQLADYVLKAGGEEIPVSAPVWGDLRPSSARNGHRRRLVTLGFAAQDATLVRGLVGHDARLVSNVAHLGRDLGQVRVLAVDLPMALVVVDLLPGTREEAVSPSNAVASPPGTEATHG